MTSDQFRAGFDRSWYRSLIRCLAIIVAAAAMAAGPWAVQPVMAQEEKGAQEEKAAPEKMVGIELNRLQAVQGACRISLVVTNGLAEPVEALSVETVIFDKEGAVERFLALKSNPLPSGKVRVQQFDVKGLVCDRIGKVLLNDVKECKIEGVSPDDCLGVIRPSSRIDAAFYSSTVAAADKKTQ